MGEKLPVLKVRLFGKEKITYDSNVVLYGRNTVTKGMRLLLILFYYGKRGINRNILLENLYGEEDLSDASNNLRVTIHRLKKMLIDAGLPEGQLVFVVAADRPQMERLSGIDHLVIPADLFTHFISFLAGIPRRNAVDKC